MGARNALAGTARFRACHHERETRNRPRGVHGRRPRHLGEGVFGTRICVRDAHEPAAHSCSRRRQIDQRRGEKDRSAHRGFWPVAFDPGRGGARTEHSDGVRQALRSGPRARLQAQRREYGGAGNSARGRAPTHRARQKQGNPPARRVPKAATAPTRPRASGAISRNARFLAPCPRWPRAQCGFTGPSPSPPPRARTRP